MTQQKPTLAPTGRIAGERELFENLRKAAWTFEKEKDGRFLGSIDACIAVMRFIYQRDRGAELAIPFQRTREAFEVLSRGGKPALFTKRTVTNKERSRSPERKQIQRMAATFLEVLVKLGDDLDTAAARIAVAVNDWPGMSKQTVKGTTVINWRKQLRSDNDEKFWILVAETQKQPDPRITIERWLKKGPLGLWRG